MIRSTRVLSSADGFGMVEMVIASGLILLFILAGSSLHAVYQGVYSGMAKNTKARILGLQMVSEMKSHYGRYPYARSGGEPVTYRRCYGRNLELIPIGTELVRILTDGTLTAVCDTAFQVDIIPDNAIMRVYTIDVKVWSSRTNLFEAAGQYYVAF